MKRLSDRCPTGAPLNAQHSVPNGSLDIPVRVSPTPLTRSVSSLDRAIFCGLLGPSVMRSGMAAYANVSPVEERVSDRSTTPDHCWPLRTMAHTETATATKRTLCASLQAAVCSPCSQTRRRSLCVGYRRILTQKKLEFMKGIICVEQDVTASCRSSIDPGLYRC